jgi:hypothetical protein
MKNNKQIKLLDEEIQKKIKGKRNISYQRLEKFLRTFQIVLKKYLLENKELIFKNFLKLGPRIAKDRIVTTASYIGRNDLKPKKIHMPQHLRFKATFCQDFKDYLNKEK